MKIDDELMNEREEKYSLRIRERLAFHLDLLTQVQLAIQDGLDLIIEAHQSINLETVAGRLGFVTMAMATRVVGLSRSCLLLFMRGYALEAAGLSRALFELTVVYEYLRDNSAEMQLYLDEKLTTTEALKRLFGKGNLSRKMTTSRRYMVCSVNSHILRGGLSLMQLSGMPLSRSLFFVSRLTSRKG